MANVFCITYGGRSRNGNVFVPYTAIAHTADEAIDIINTWHTYGHYEQNIHVNDYTAGKIRELFEKGIKPEHQGQRACYGNFRTTGCGCWDISFYPALADTLEEHERIYKEQREAARKERLRLAEEAKQRRMAELMEPRKGWWHVELELELMVFATKGNDYVTHSTWEGNTVADSGMDAYNKVVKYVKEHPEELTHRGNMALLQFYAQPDSGNGLSYDCTFLGVKTDEGYSVEKWEEWHRNGEI